MGFWLLLLTALQWAGWTGWVNGNLGKITTFITAFTWFVMASAIFGSQSHTMGGLVYLVIAFGSALSFLRICLYRRDDEC